MERISTISVGIGKGDFTFELLYPLDHLHEDIPENDGFSFFGLPFPFVLLASPLCCLYYQKDFF